MDFARVSRSAESEGRLSPLPESGRFAALAKASSLALPKGLECYFAAKPGSGTAAIAQFPEDSGGSAVAACESSGYESIFCASPCLSPQFIARVADLAGVWRYVPEGNIALCDGRLLGATCPKGGTLEISLPEKAEVSALDGSLVGSSLSSFKADFRPGETKIFLLKRP